MKLTSVACPLVISFAAFFALHSDAFATPVFSEDFNSLAHAAAITTSNTSFDYVRVGSGGGSITAKNPSTISTGASMLLAGPTNASLNGVGIKSTLGLESYAELSLLIKFTDVTTGTLVIGMGTGTMFTSDSAFTGSHFFFGLQILGGVLQYRSGTSGSGAWTSTGYTFTNSNTTYDLDIVANGANLQISINNTPLPLITNSRNAQLATGFRIYTVNPQTSYEIDDISIVPEPSALALCGMSLVGLAGVCRGRRKIA